VTDVVRLTIPVCLITPTREDVLCLTHVVHCGNPLASVHEHECDSVDIHCLSSLPVVSSVPRGSDIGKTFSKNEIKK
jgi:hypothetical protein